MNDGAQAYMELAPNFQLDASAHERALQTAGAAQPTLAVLVKHTDRFGPDGVLESGCHLSDVDYAKLAVHVRKVGKLSRWSKGAKLRLTS